jgi:putative hemin transport protein
MAPQPHTQAQPDRPPARLLASAWRTMVEQAARPPRARDAAAQLGVSEGELIAATVASPGPGNLRAVRLEGDAPAILAATPTLGAVKAITRNEHVVHEKVGTFDHVSVSGSMGLVLNHDIDLRLFMGHWRHLFLVHDAWGNGTPRASLQVFDASGEAVHKIYSLEDADLSPFHALEAQFRSPEQSPELAVLPPMKVRPDAPDDSIDVEGFRAHWADLQDTHDFFGLLKDFGVGRHQAMRLADPQFAREVSLASARAMLEGAAARAVSIMCFVGNPGCIQIHTGAIEKVAVMGPWLNVLDAGFNLHLREDRIASAWVVRKPTRDGIVTSLELFDADNKNFVMFFGERKPGKPEREDWRQLITDVTAPPPAVAA